MTGSTDIQHDLLLLALDTKLYTSPTISETATVLDVGTGTGTWACQMALHYKKARIYGIDLQQVTPQEMPSNVVFETVNVMTGFPFNTGTFDFVHSRLLIGGITSWHAYLENLVRITKRGGYVECIELELLPCSDCQATPATLAWTQRMASVLTEMGLEPDAALRLRANMEAAGFVEVEDKIIETPIGGCSNQDTETSKQIARLAQEFSKIHIVQWLSDLLLTRGVDKQDIKRDSDLVLQELSRPEAKMSFRWHFCTGRKGA